jgi:hypothetical protein
VTPALDRGEPVGRLELVCGAGEIGDGDQDVVELQRARSYAGSPLREARA